MERETDARLLIRIDEKVSNILRRMDGYDSQIANIDARIDRVELRFSNRLSKLENWRWLIVGIATGVSFIISYFGDRLF